MRYFQAFPTITYKATRVKDITRRVKVLDEIKNYATLFYNYTIKDNERPDTIAYNYYGSPYYFWVIFLVNDIIDPYYDWPLSQNELESLIIEKYGSLEEAQSTILHYTKKASNWYASKTNIYHVISEDDWSVLSAGEKTQYSLLEGTDTGIISPTTYDGLSSGDKTKYSPVYAYDNEFDQNEAKRHIKLLDLRYLPLIEKEFIDKMGA